jgi:hypothetical protein
MYAAALASTLQAAMTGARLSREELKAAIDAMMALVAFYRRVLFE